MLVHSRLYYELDEPLITDAEFDKRAKELAKLQAQYPEIAARVCYAKAFEGWDGSTGAFLPLNDAWAVKKANELIKIMEKQNEHTKIQQQTRETSRQSVKRKGTAGQRVNSFFKGDVNTDLFLYRVQDCNYCKSFYEYQKRVDR